jgi:hypothetical protein
MSRYIVKTMNLEMLKLPTIWGGGSIYLLLLAVVCVIYSDILTYRPWLICLLFCMYVAIQPNISSNSTTWFWWPVSWAWCGLLPSQVWSWTMKLHAEHLKSVSSYAVKHSFFVCFFAVGLGVVAACMLVILHLLNTFQFAHFMPVHVFNHLNP